jgi:hypothetical protein
MELKDAITLVSVLFGIVGGIFAYMKWKPQEKSIEADIVGKVIANLEKMTDLYDECRETCDKLEKEIRRLKRPKP